MFDNRTFSHPSVEFGNFARLAVFEQLGLLLIRPKVVTLECSLALPEDASVDPSFGP